MTAKSNAAITLEREQEKRIVKLLRLSGQNDPVIVKGTVRALSEDVIELAFSTPASPPAVDRRNVKTAWLCKTSGSVQIIDGLPA